MNPNRLGKPAKMRSMEGRYLDLPAQVFQIITAYLPVASSLRLQQEA